MMVLRVIKGKQLDGVDFVDLLLDDAGLSKHTFLPFYNEPQIANASTRIFAARMQYEGVAYKLHWITSPGKQRKRWKNEMISNNNQMTAEGGNIY